MGDLNDSAIFSEIDPSNNSINSPSFPEGMLPSLLNDNARAFMGSMKRFRDWICGAATVGGTANAITLTFPQSPALLIKGDRYVFFPTADNTGATTLTVGTLAVKAIQRNGAPLIGGEIKTGIPIEVVFDDVQFQLFRLAENFSQLTGVGQATGNWNTFGAKGGSIALLDTGVAVGNGGAVEFGAAGGTWRFAAIKGYVQNGSANSSGDLVFATRTNPTDGVLTEKARITAGGALVCGAITSTGTITASNLSAAVNIFANGNITTSTMNAVNIAASNALNCLNFGASGSGSVASTFSANSIVANGILSNGNITAANAITANAGYYGNNFANIIALNSGPYNVFYDGSNRQSFFLGGGADPTIYVRNTQTVIQDVGGAQTYATFNSFGTTTLNLSVAGVVGIGGGLTAASATVNSFVANGGGTPIFAPNGSIQAAGNVVASGSLISGGSSSIGNALTVGGSLQVNNGATILGTINTNALGVTGGATISGQALCGEVFSVGAVRFAGDPNFYITNTGPDKIFNYAASWFWDWSTGNGDLTWFSGGLGDHTCMEAGSAILNCRKGPVRGLGLYQSTSDRRSKQDIVPTNQGLDTILNLNPVTFKRIGRKNAAHIRPDGVEHKLPEPQTEIGFIAQEVREFLPVAVHEAANDLLPEEDGQDTPLLSVSYESLIPVMVNGFKELNTRILNLETALAKKTKQPATK